MKFDCKIAIDVRWTYWRVLQQVSVACPIRMGRTYRTHSCTKIKHSLFRRSNSLRAFTVFSWTLSKVSYKLRCHARPDEMKWRGKKCAKTKTRNGSMRYEYWNGFRAMPAAYYWYDAGRWAVLPDTYLITRKKMKGTCSRWAKMKTKMHLDWNSIAMPTVLHYFKLRKNGNFTLRKRIREEDGKLERWKLTVAAEQWYPHRSVARTGRKPSDHWFVEHGIAAHLVQSFGHRRWHRAGWRLHRFPCLSDRCWWCR